MDEVLRQVIDKIKDLNCCLIGSANLKYQGLEINPNDLDFLTDDESLEKIAEVFNCQIITNDDNYRECEFMIDGVEVHFVTPSWARQNQLGQKVVLYLNSLKVRAATLESELDFYQKCNRLKDQDRIKLIEEFLVTG